MLHHWRGENGDNTGRKGCTGGGGNEEMNKYIHTYTYIWHDPGLPASQWGMTKLQHPIPNSMHNEGALDVVTGNTTMLIELSASYILTLSNSRRCKYVKAIVPFCIARYAPPVNQCGFGLFWLFKGESLAT